MAENEKQITTSTCKIKDGKLFVKSSALAILEGVTSRTVRNYRQRGIPTEDNQWFDYAKVRKWLREQEGVIKAEEEDTNINWKQRQLIADTRLKQAKADKEELDLKRLKGETTTIKKAQEGLILFMTSFRFYYTHLSKDIMNKIESFIPKREAHNIFVEIRDTIEDFVKGYIDSLEKKRKGM